MSNVCSVIDAGYAYASGPKSVGDTSPNPSLVIKCRFEVWKKKTNLIFFQVWFFFSSFALCFVSYFLSSIFLIF
jgi:hypothetical protein